MSALAGYWAPDSTARLWPHALAAVLGARDRGSGLSVWLDLIGYPGLLVLYAFGLGASISRHYGTLATILAAPVPDEQKQWRPAIVVVNSAYLREDVAIKLSGAKSARWPLSDHLLSAARPWFAEIVPSDALFELMAETRLAATQPGLLESLGKPDVGSRREDTRRVRRAPDPSRSMHLDSHTMPH